MNWNGPTHTGLLENLSPSFLSCAGDMTIPERSASWAVSGAYGSESFSSIVLGSATFTDSTGSSSLARLDASSVRCRSSDVLTASASNVVPSLNLMPWRRAIVTVLPPSLNLGSDAASCGTICSLLLTSYSFSHMFANTMRPTNVRASVGSSRSGSSASATVIVPPALAGPLLAVPPVPTLLPPLLPLLPPQAARISAATTAATAEVQIRRMLTPPSARRPLARLRTRSAIECHAAGWQREQSGRRTVRRAARAVAPWQCSRCAQRPPLPPDPGADERAGPRAAGALGPDDRPPRARVRRPRPGRPGAPARRVRHDRAGRRLPLLGDRGLGGGARQHALARRSRARLRDRPLRDAVARAGREARARRRLHPGRLAARRRPRRRRGAPARRPVRFDPRGLRRAQRDVDRRVQPRRRGARRDGRRRPRRPPARRHDLLARLDRLPPRRVARRRDDRLLAEGADAAARARVQRGQRAGRGGLAGGGPRALLLGLGADPRRQRRRRVAVHAADEPPLRPARGARPAPRRGSRRRVRPSRAPRGGDAPRRPRVGPRARAARRPRALELADGGAAARRPRRRRAARAHPRPLRHVPRRRAREARGPGVPHRPPRRPQRRLARGRAGRRRDGAARGGRAGRPRRRAGGDRPPGGDGPGAGLGPGGGGGPVSAIASERPPAEAAELERRLASALDGGARFDAYSRHLYSRDASAYAIEPLGVCFPRHAGDVAAAVAVCAGLGVPVLARGGGTSLAGQCVARGLVLDLSRHMRSIVELDADARRAVVQPGVIQEQLNRDAAKRGVQFGPNTSTANRATLGGMIANNSAGSQSIKYGMTIDAVERLDVVLSDASRARLEAVSEAERAARAATGNGSLEAAIYRDPPGNVERRREAPPGYPRPPRPAGRYRPPPRGSGGGLHPPPGA